MSAPDRLTLAEIVARNVRDVRKKKRRLSVHQLAGKLGVGEHIVRDMERPRKGQSQREFTWSELVALCGALDTNLFELVLPPEDVEVADARKFLLTDTDSPDVAVYHPNAQIGRDGLGWRVFGVPGNSLTPEVLKQMASNLSDEYDRRISRVEEILGIGSRIFNPDPDLPRDDLPLTTEIDLFDADGRHVKTVILPHVGEPDSEEE